MCNSSSSVLNRTSQSLLHTFVVDTLFNFLVPFNIILTYTNTSHLKAFRRLLVHIGMCLVLSPFLSELAGKDIAHFSLESGRVFEETTGVYERIYSGAPNVNFRKISVRKTI